MFFIQVPEIDNWDPVYFPFVSCSRSGKCEVWLVLNAICEFRSSKDQDALLQPAPLERPNTLETVTKSMAKSAGKMVATVRNGKHFNPARLLPDSREGLVALKLPSHPKWAHQMVMFVPNRLHNSQALLWTLTAVWADIKTVSK